MSSQDKTAHDDVRWGEVYQPLIRSRKRIWQGTLIATALAGVLGVWYLLVQPVTWSAILGFRPVFAGATAGQYPNGLLFAPSDIVNPSVIEQVLEKNRIEESCPANLVRAALTLQESSPNLQFLSLEYQARLNDVRLTAVDRQRIQDEYAARRAALQPQYQLVFVRPPECDRLAQAVVFKILAEILEVWATDSEDKRGVMKLRVAILTPGVFDQASASSEPLLVRADLIRTAMVRVIANINAVEQLPGAQLVRVGNDRLSLVEVRARISDLVQARLDPLISLSGQGLGRQSIRWVEQALQTATGELRAAQQRAESYRLALREYSGVTMTPTGGGKDPGDRQPNASDVQALTPQIDRTFIDRIVELSATNTEFRQEITRQVIDMSVDAVDKASRVEHYSNLLESMKGANTESLTTAHVEQRLSAITAEARAATQRFVELYEEFSRVSLRVGPMMYRVESPAYAVVTRGFGIRSLAVITVVVFVVTPILLSLVLLARHYARRFVAISDPPPT